MPFSHARTPPPPPPPPSLSYVHTSSATGYMDYDDSYNGYAGHDPSSMDPRWSSQHGNNYQDYDDCHDNDFDMDFGGDFGF